MGYVEPWFKSTKPLSEPTPSYHQLHTKEHMKFVKNDKKIILKKCSGEYHLPPFFSGFIWKRAKGHFLIMVSSYQYRNSHYVERMVSWSCLYNGNPYTGKNGLHIETRSCIPFGLISETHTRRMHSLLILAVANCLEKKSKKTFDLNHCGLVEPYGWHRSGSTFAESDGLLPDDTKLLPESMLTYHQRCFVAFTS